MIVNFTSPLFTHGVKVRGITKGVLLCSWKKNVVDIEWHYWEKTSTNYGVSFQASHYTLHYCILACFLKHPL